MYAMLLQMQMAACMNILGESNLGAFTTSALYQGTCNVWSCCAR